MWDAHALQRLQSAPGAPYTLRPTPYTLHPTPYTLHPTPYTLHPTSLSLFLPFSAFDQRPATSSSSSLLSHTHKHTQAGLLPQRKEEEVGEVVVATLDDLELEALVLWEHPPAQAPDAGATEGAAPKEGAAATDGAAPEGGDAAPAVPAGAAPEEGGIAPAAPVEVADAPAAPPPPVQVFSTVT